MLHFGLVLLVVASAIAAPSYDWFSIQQVPENAVGPVKNIGRTNHLTDWLSTLTDGGDTAVNIITLQNVVNDLAGQPDSASQAIAMGQAIGITLALATGRSGDACNSANLIESYTSGRSEDTRRHLYSFVDLISNNLGLIVNLAKNSQAAAYSVGPVTGCQGEGRSYDIEGAWNAILASANNNNNALLNESYCVVKRLYCGNSARSNNVAAVVTASSLPPVVEVYQQASGAIANLVQSLSGNGNYGQALANAKQALTRAVKNVAQ